MGSIALESIKLSQTARVVLFELDATRLGAGVHYFSPQTNELGAGVTWQGTVYQPLPFEASGFEQTSTGAFPRPRARVSNALGTLGPLLRAHDGLRGALVIVHATYARFLDAVNFANGNPDADPLAEEPLEVWAIDRTVGRSRWRIEWELANPLDVMGVLIPARTIHDDYCNWMYRSSDCGYTGGPVAKRDDSPTALAQEDDCSKRLSGCRLRFGNGLIPGGMFPGVGKVRQA